MRSKEMSHDYRYFPEPDLEPLDVDPARLAAIRSDLPEPPAARAARLESEYGLPAYDAGVLTGDALAGRLVRGGGASFRRRKGSLELGHG